jgi:5'-nucleotidase (lipoprotein e(P4) family)
MKKNISLSALLLIGILALILPACKEPDPPQKGKKADQEVIMSVLYQQQAAEYRALCLQAYNIAKERLIASAHLKTDKDSLAIITDLDETALDNSAFEAQLILDDSTYSGRRFTEWVKMKKAGAVPGSVAFFNFANDLNTKLKKKIDVFYVSNRDVSLVGVTMDNMSRLGFPQLTPGHFLFCPDPKKPSKESRRQLIEKNHTVLLLLGDNLIDLDYRFDSDQKLTGGERARRVDSLAGLWGMRYIVFPNAIYGDWESSLNGYSHPPADTVMRIRRDSLLGYDRAGR